MLNRDKSTKIRESDNMFWKAKPKFMLTNASRWMTAAEIYLKNPPGYAIIGTGNLVLIPDYGSLFYSVFQTSFAKLKTAQALGQPAQKLRG